MNITIKDTPVSQGKDDKRFTDMAKLNLLLSQLKTEIEGWEEKAEKYDNLLSGGKEMNKENGLPMLSQNAFYSALEPQVRDWVYRLRNAGVNTECSCEHEGYIQCQVLDPTRDVQEIKTVMLTHNIEKFEISILYKGYEFSTLEIRADIFKS